MDPARQKEIASQGGREAHKKGVAHEFDTEEARNAGRKGGLAISQNSLHMATIGKKGGTVRGANARKKKEAPLTIEPKEKSLS